jgi:FkbM family methyltransferase
MMHGFLRAIGAGRLKSGIKLTISRHRQSLPVRMLHEIASFIEEAHANEGADFATNGEHDLLKKLSRADFRTVFDVGANKGAWSISALSIWPNCRVHAFEVAPQTYRELQECVRATPYADRIEMNDFGASDISGARTMYYYPRVPEFTGEARRHGDEEAVTFEGKLVTLDEYC